MNKYHKQFNWHYTRWGGFIVVNLFKVWSLIHRKRQIYIDVGPINRKNPIILASNHMSFFDPPAVFSALNIKDQLRYSPVKFMTSRKYYYSILWPLLYTTGSFPHKGDAKSGVEGAIMYSNEGYSIFMFPEGKLNRTYKYSHAYSGTSRIMDGLSDPKLYLVNIFWEKRKRFFSRPILRILITEANNKYASVEKIMKDIYAMPGRFGIK